MADADNGNGCGYRLILCDKKTTPHLLGCYLEDAKKLSCQGCVMKGTSTCTVSLDQAGTIKAGPPERVEHNEANCAAWM